MFELFCGDTIAQKQSNGGKYNTIVSTLMIFSGFRSSWTVIFLLFFYVTCKVINKKVLRMSETDLFRDNGKFMMMYAIVRDSTSWADVRPSRGSVGDVTEFCEPCDSVLSYGKPLNFQLILAQNSHISPLTGFLEIIRMPEVSGFSFP